MFVYHEARKFNFSLVTFIIINLDFLVEVANDANTDKPEHVLISIVKYEPMKR